MRLCSAYALACVIALLLCMFTQTSRADAAASTAPVSLQIELGALDSDLWSDRQSTPDVVKRSYRIATAPGAAAQTTTVTGYSLYSFLTAWEQHEQVSSSRVKLVEIPGESGTTLITAAEAMADPSTVTTPVPVFWTGGQGQVGFADGTPDDYVSPVDQIRVYTGQQLTVGITAKKHTIADGTDASLSASVSPSSGQLQYAWFIVGNGEDDRTTTGATYKAAFSTEGSYRAYVVVTDPSDGSIGVSDQIAINVGPPPKRTPAKHNDGTNKHKHAPKSGASTKGSQTAKHHTKRSKSTSSTAAKSHAQAKHSAKARPKHTKQTSTTATKHKSAAVRRRPAAPLLSGIAVTSPSDAATRRSASSRRSATTPAPGAQDPAQAGHAVKAVSGHGLHLGEGFWIAFGVVAALSAGGLLESGALRRRLARKDWLGT